MSLWKLAFVLAIVTIGATDTLSAQSVTAFKTGENTTGMTKQCFYNALGNTHTRTIGSIELCPLNIQVRMNPSSPQGAPPSTYRPPAPATITAFKKGEQTTGMTKQCFYDGLGSLYTRTIGSIELCPLNIQVRLNGS